MNTDEEREMSRDMRNDEEDSDMDNYITEEEANQAEEKDNGLNEVDKEACKTLVLLNHDYRKSLRRAASYESVDDLKKQCAVFGCSLAKELTKHYCCDGHEKYAEELSNENYAFHHFGGFTGPSHRNSMCSSSVVLMSDNISVGIPTLEDPNIFSTYPWDQTHLFCTTKPPQPSNCDWLFFHKPPDVYRYISTEPKVYWKGGSKTTHPWKGHEVTVQNLTLRFDDNKKSQDFKDEQGGTWMCILFQYKDVSLYCLSFSKPKVAAKKPKISDKDNAQDDGNGNANADTSDKDKAQDAGKGKAKE